MTEQKDKVTMADWATTREAGELLGVTPRHVNWLIAHGRLEAIKLNSRLTLVSRESISRRLAGQGKGDTSKK